MSYNFTSDTITGIIFTLFAAILNLVVAFVEEITYRYDGMYVFKRNKLMCIIMLIFSSILFGFSHSYNFNASFLATGPYILAGVVLGVSYLVSKNIWVPIIAHILFNSIDLLATVFLIVATVISKI